MSNERKPSLSAEPGGIGPKVRGSPPAPSAEPAGSVPEVSGPKFSGQKVIDCLLRRFRLILESIIFRDTIKFFGWIASILIIAGLCWALTESVRNRFLTRAVNRVLEQYGDSRRVAELSSSVGTGGASLIGSWHTMIKARQQGISTNDDFPDGTTAFVFSFIAEGTIFPCVAVVDPIGRVQEFIPLSVHGKKILSRISPGILKLYIRRIEGSGS
jgi:hypothetical protein